MLDSQSQRLHEETVLKARRYLIAEAELLNAIIEIDRHRLYEKFGETHLTHYCVKHLNLSEDVAGLFIRVARKSRKVPALAAAVDEGLQMSKARTIAPVINPENQDVWIEKAQTLTRNQLEREVAAANPSAPKPEKAKPVGLDRVRIEFEVSDEDAALLARARELLSQKENSFASLGEAVMAAVRDWVDREDPVRRAKRATERQAKRSASSSSRDSKQAVNLKRESEEFNPRQMGSTEGRQTARKNNLRTKTESAFHKTARSHPPRDGSKLSIKRKPLPARVLHQVYHRDGGACQVRHADGSLCGSRRWIHLHHLTPKSEGGSDAVENLVTVCGAHHRIIHRSPQNFKFELDSPLLN